MAQSTFKVGDKVRWISSNIYKVGTVELVVPAGSSAIGLGAKLRDEGIPRNHESYVVRGRRVTHHGKPQGRLATYWPLVSLLRPA